MIFDTVFTTIGTTTENFRIYNTDNKVLRIDEISIHGAYASVFRINVDGLEGPLIKGIEILPGDSLYIFVEATLDANGGNLPLVVEAQIQFLLSTGQTQQVQLVAWGQDAHFHVADSYIPGLPPYSLVSGLWTNDKPHVIYDYVVIDENQLLTIREGVQIYLHKHAGIWVFQGGRLIVLGTQDEPVVFQGDRLEDFYDDVAGQWDRIWINEAAGNSFIRNAIIRNSYIGIQAETLPFGSNMVPQSSNKLILQDVVIENCSGIGILARNYQIDATNLLVTNCGNYNLAVSGGGLYNFTHSTFANYWSESTRTTPTVILVNYYQGADNIINVRDLTECNFNNSIIYGNIENEFEIDPFSSGQFNYRLDHCIVKTTEETTDTTFYSSAIVNPVNEDLFVSPFDADYHLRLGSPAINRGSPNFTVSTPMDLDGKDRTSDEAPDLGVYELDE